MRKLSDAFGQVLVDVRCSCGYSRLINPEALAPRVEWEAPLESLKDRMRCSQCGKKAADVVAVSEPRPRGVPKNPH
jgi:DNA-directed RNA polymerase subunit RPC12/RpoP